MNLHVPGVFYIEHEAVLGVGLSKEELGILFKKGSNLGKLKYIEAVSFSRMRRKDFLRVNHAANLN